MQNARLSRHRGLNKRATTTKCCCVLQSFLRYIFIDLKSLVLTNRAGVAGRLPWLKKLDGERHLYTEEASAVFYVLQNN
jgi:hypothetical protein